MKEDLSKSLGERIRELREAKDLSLREFARKLDVSAAFLSDVELGRRHPSEKVLLGMAKLLAMPVDELKSYDSRPTVEALKRMVSQNPAFGFAFRKMIDKDISPEELMEIIEKKRRR